ncbi:hypothetical protein FRX31_033538 [Thalictrum thalictroides]|uniref:Uncharacterized protein n=1 Tax=Thalictrum thalictroides TaxID=46969 RepID=A0A7J6UXH0_THATH|nr:hypothetical protein FRX31_033538 [Thalictrum thalictroides]
MARKRRIQYKKKLHQPKTTQDTTMKIPTSTTVDEVLKIEEDKEVEDSSGFEVYSSDYCSTPKAERNRIPNIVLCPPAPKKRKVVSPCSSLRSPISFFAPPDIEHFFYFAVHTVV